MKTWFILALNLLLWPISRSEAQIPARVPDSIPVSELPQLTRSQFVADFDTLCSVLARVNPHDFVRRTVNGYSMMDSIRALRPGLDSINSAASFYALVTRALTYCQDGHTSTVSVRLFGNVDSLDARRWFCSPQDTSIVKAYSALYRHQQERYRLLLPIRYVEGDYRVWTDFSYRQIRVPFGATLVGCNGQTIHAFVSRLLSYAPDMHWDFKNRRFYTEDFTRSRYLSASDSVSLTFRWQGQSITQRVALSDTVNTGISVQPARQDRRQIVSYFADQQLLYIRMPVMANGAFYRRRIDSLVRNQPIRKIVFDIRDNPGGSDPEWQAVLCHLIAKPIVRPIVTCANGANPRADRLNLSGPNRLFKAAFLPDSLYQIVSAEPDTLAPDSSSIRFEGKIYILQNENCFSSAGSLILTCQFSDQLINTGNSTGWFAGFGSMPWVMILPHSKILYWIEPLLDFTNVKQVGDLFHNKVKLPVNLTLDEYRSRTCAKDRYGADFLFGYDPVFKTVLNQP